MFAGGVKCYEVVAIQGGRLASERHQHVLDDVQPHTAPRLELQEKYSRSQFGKL